MKTSRIMLLFFLLALPLLAEAIPLSGANHADGYRAEKLRVAVTDDPPYTMRGENGRWAGFNVDLWTQVARGLKWDYELVEMSFEDILRALHRGTIDVSIAGIFQTAEREKLFEFSTPLGSTRLALATLPNKIEHPWLSALRIFISWSTLKVIGILLVMLFITGLAFWLIERHRNPEHFGGGFIRGVGAGIYWVGSTLASGVCFGIYLKSIPGRIAGLFWMFVCAIVLSAFIASLTSSLTLTKLSTPVLDVHGLKPMVLGTVKGSVPAGLVQKMGMKYTLFTEEQDALEALRNKQIDGFLCDEATLNYYASGVVQPAISVYPTNLKRLPFAFSMPNGSRLRKEINGSLLSFMDEPYWDFLTNYYGLSENQAEMHAFGRRQRR
jgi:polar amino acid transport system substrate-binding protein